MLILPDHTMLEHAKAWNTRLLGSDPDGFALDALHTPHITLLQRYVQTDRLDDVYASSGTTVAATPVATLQLSAVKLAHMDLAALPGTGLAGLVCQASPGVIDLQSALIDAVKPFTATGGTADAFVTTDAEPDINADTLHYVEGYVPDHSGDNFLAHVTVGQGKLAHLTEFEAEPFAPFTFQPAGFAIYHLGNNGTAQAQLHQWDLT